MLAFKGVHENRVGYFPGIFVTEIYDDMDESRAEQIDYLTQDLKVRSVTKESFFSLNGVENEDH